MSENPYILPAQRGYSREDGWHWLLMNEDREVVGLLIELPAPRHHQGLWGVPKTVNAKEMPTTEDRVSDLEAGMRYLVGVLLHEKGDAQTESLALYERYLARNADDVRSHPMPDYDADLLERKAGGSCPTS